MMHRSLYWSAMDELRSLRVFAERTGCNLQELVEVTPAQRASIDRFCQHHPPGHTKSIREALQMRDWMLERL